MSLVSTDLQYLDTDLGKSTDLRYLYTDLGFLYTDLTYLDTDLRYLDTDLGYLQTSGTLIHFVFGKYPKLINLNF